ncbi:hypothetical protein NLU13_3891 [Sarocladium strictum]|uniref:AB hydrolase-1 domain-containing protein n=1 Tax=Sarocladium strictum TaxID=5046 RepID=A0AA39L7Q3_SARSR|nr:hypothetical protein NLU13_3891 [Sarocladium strictum]
MGCILPLLSAGLLAFASITSSAHTGSAQTATSKKCIDLEISVPVKADQWRYDQPRIDSNIDAMDWTKHHIEEIFTISAKLCIPSRKSSKSNILQIASPGQAFDKRYFDVEIDPEQYSYVDAAIKKGYSVLAYDRLGTGASTKPDAYDTLQLPVDTELLASLTTMASRGDLISSSKVLSVSGGSTADFDFKPSKIVHIGHAYGSFLMMQMLVKYGSISDGALMTGIYPNQVMADNPLSVLNYNHAFPKEQDPERFSEYGSGYFVLDNEQTLQKLFYQKATLDPKLLTYTEEIKQPESVGQYASEGDIESVRSPEFRAPILFFTGEYDNYICNGDCRGIFDMDMAKGMFPHATNISSHLQPGAGHATGLSRGADAGYEVMLSYLDMQGL